jgi:hypothetical protein
LEAHGFADLQEPIRRAFVQNDHAEMIRLALPMAEVLAVAGTPEECREKLAAYDTVADRVVLGGAWIGPPPGRIEANQRSIIESLAPA